MIDDAAVRSVRVAVALCDRFAELLKGPSQVTARKQHGALLGVGGNQDDLSLRIGEAQQLYPEIWRHRGRSQGARCRLMLHRELEIKIRQALAANLRPTEP